MSIITSSIRNSNGTTYTITTDSPSDWASVANSTYFKNLSDGVIYYKTPTSNIVNVISSSYAISASVAATASYFAGTVTTALTASYVLPLSQSVFITGSLNLIGNSTHTGSVFHSGSKNLIGVFNQTGSMIISGSSIQIGTNTLLGNTILSGSIIISGSTTTPTTPTIKIYGDMETDGVIKFMPVSKNIDTSISASYIFVSGSTNDLYFSQNGSGYNNVTRLRWLEGNLYTGLLHGGLITTQSSTTYQVASGSGIIVNLNASVGFDPYPIVQYLNWGNVSASIASLSASYDQQFIAINSSSQIVAQGIPFNDSQFNTLIPIGLVLHQNHSTINGVKTSPSVAYGWKQRSSDFIRAFGPLKISGYAVLPSGSATGSLTVGNGTAFVDGANYAVDPNNPSYAVDNGTTVSKIFRYYQSGSDWVYNTNNGAGYQSLDPVYYNPGGLGVLDTVGASNYSLQRVFWYPNSVTKAITVYYGNERYGTLALAQAGLASEVFNEAPNTTANAVYLGAFAIKGGTNTTLQNSAHFTWLPGGLFRGSGGGGSGGGGTTTPGGSTTQIQYNNAGAFGGVPTLTYDGTTLTATGVFTGSLQGTASYANTASYALVFPYTGLARITGSLGITGSLSVLEAGVTSLNTTTYTLRGTNGNTSIDWGSRELRDGSNTISANWRLRSAYDSAQSESIGWSARRLYSPTGNVILDWSTGTFTGTASFATQALSASWAPGTAPGGTNTMVQFNTSGSFDGIGGITVNKNAQSFQNGESVSAVGSYSHAEGEGTTASGQASHAEGFYAVANGNHSHAEGNTATANGTYSHAEGYYTTANGYASHAEGTNTISNGQASHAEGNTTTANGPYSHTEGRSTITGNASGYYATMTASGVFTLSASYGDLSSAGLFDTGYIIGVDDSQYDNNWTYTNLTAASCSFNGTNTLVHVTDTSFLVSTASIGGITNFGNNAGDQVWGGYAAHAQGISITAQGAYSHAEGNSSNAYGVSSHAEGSSNAYGVSSHAEGGGQTFGAYSHAEGGGQTFGAYSHAEGSGYTYGEYSHAEGSSTAGYNAYRMNAHITGGVIDLEPIYGDQTTYFGAGGFAVVFDGSGDLDPINNTQNTYLFEVLSSAFTSSLTQITLVDNTVTTFTAFDKIRIGVYGTPNPPAADVPLGSYSHAEGSNAKTIGEYSHAAGNTTEALGWYQSVVGMGNKPISDRGAFIVGDGDPNNSIQHNLLVAAAGSVVISGSLQVSGSLRATSFTGSLTGSVTNYETAWTPYTPVWTTDGGTQPVLGNGSLTGAYKQIGKTVFVRVKLNWGTTTTGGTGAFIFTLPVTASNADGIQFPCSMLNNGSAWYQGTVNGTYSGFTNRSAIIGQSAGANSSEGITSTFPFAWGSTDSLQFNGTYESI